MRVNQIGVCVLRDLLECMHVHVVRSVSVSK